MLLKEKIIISSIVLILAVILFSAGVFITKTPDSFKKSNTKETSFEIRYYFLAAGYTAPVVSIKNNTENIWADCDMKINDQYSARIATIGSADTKIISILDFFRKDGKQFDYSALSPRSACVVCLEPNYNSYCGKFKDISE